MDSSLMHIVPRGVIKKISNFHLKQKFCFAEPKTSVTFGGEGGAITKILSIMIYLKLNRFTDFSIGVHYKSRRLYNHSVYSLTLSVIIFSLSFVITKYNS
jgi:hypothetical protein